MAELIKKNKMYGGWVQRYRHSSAVLGCSMTFTVYLPPGAEAAAPAPVVFVLSGLTCTDDNFTTKAGAQRAAAELGLALVMPDTSPRGLDVPGEAESYDFGVGAGFYLNATEPKWAAWRMYDYVLEELPALLRAIPGLDVDKASIMGHSMGGHGALTLSLKNPSRFASVSAFAPISNPSQVPWGQKAFAGYLGEDREAWKAWDATELVGRYSGPPLPVLIDTGSEDEFRDQQLRPEAFAAAAGGKLALTNRTQEGYDHSYFFIATFVGEHLAFHAQHLRP